MTSTELAVAGQTNALSTAATLYDQIKDPLEFIKTMGTALAQSKVAGCKTTGDGQVMAWACLSLRKNPFEIADESHFIDGKLTCKADSALMKFQDAGGKSKWIKDGTDGSEAILELVGPDGVRIESKFTIEMAKRAQLVRKDSNWEKWPAEMLRSRCITSGIRMQWPGILKGRYSTDEIIDAEFVDKTPAKTRAKITPAPETASKSPTNGDSQEVVDAVVEPVKQDQDAQINQIENSAPVETSVSERAPFDAGDAAESSEVGDSNGDSSTSFDPVVLEIELITGQLGQTNENIVMAFNKRLGASATSIDDFTDEQRGSILEALRSALKKFEQQKLEKSSS